MLGGFWVAAAMALLLWAVWIAIGGVVIAWSLVRRQRDAGAQGPGAGRAKAALVLGAGALVLVVAALTTALIVEREMDVRIPPAVAAAGARLHRLSTAGAAYLGRVLHLTRGAR